jgi:two-component system, NarL family, sensor kinase
VRHPSPALANRHSIWWPVLAGILLAGLALLGLDLQPDRNLILYVWLPLTLAVSFTPLAIFVLRKLPGHPIAWLMLGSGVSATLCVLAVCWSRWTVAAWLAQWLWWPPLGFIPLALLLFPDGHLPSKRWRPVAGALIVTSSAATLALAIGALVEPRTFVTTVGGPEQPLTQLMAQIALLGVLLTVAASVLVTFALFARWRRANHLERRQIACLFPSAALLVIGIGLSFVGVPAAWVPAVVGLPIGFTFAVLQYQLLDLDLVIHRGFVWVLLTLIVVSIYAVSVAALGAVLGPGRSWTANLIAGAAAAACLLPAERLAQHASSRLLFGRREDPYAVLVQAGRHAEAIRDPLEVLPRLAATVVETLRVPYVAIEVATSDTNDPMIFDHGRSTAEPPRRFPMVAHGRAVGSLHVSERRPGARFSASESRLLQGLATQAAIAAEACRSSLDLQRARERLVVAREEERRQLRRDLHDSVASVLVGARMLTSAAIKTKASDDPTQTLLVSLDNDLALCTGEIRALIDGLRPASLDKGLESALRTAIGAISGSFEVTLNIDGDLVDLPAAAEVVTLRVVSEALTNVVKHSQASRCSISIIRDPSQLSISVIDDGAGLQQHDRSDRDRRGVGLDSMRSRVEEVGGWLALRQRDDGVALEFMLPTRHEPLSGLVAASGPELM